MRLGVVVVYMVGEGYEGLLDLHLSQIRRHTSVPYIIYGCAVRLSPALYGRLCDQPDIRLVDCPTTAASGRVEHSHYLELLTQAALADGATHVVTLHVDSFPIRSDWVELLVAHIDEMTPLVTQARVSTSVHLFSRAFHEKYDPRYLASEDEMNSPAFRRFLNERDPLVHSGTGYAFACHQAGLGYHELADTTVHSEPDYGWIYGDAVFHLRGAIRLATKTNDQPCGGQGWGIAALEALLKVPAHFRRLAPLAWRAPFRRRVDAGRRARMARTYAELMEDPEGAISRLRGT